jgi:putative pyoverdin transport system ATP-binding/permease protein
MEFFKFLQRESNELDRRLIIAGIFAGGLNTALIFLLTVAAGKTTHGSADLWNLVQVAVCLWAFWASKGFLMHRVTLIVEGVVRTVRLRLIDKVRRSNLQAIESIGRAPLFNLVSTHANTISRASTVIISGATSFVLVICAFLIILWLSGVAFLITLATLAFIVAIFWMNQKRIAAALSEVTATDNRFVHGFEELLDGFKELKMNSDKSQDFIEENLKPLTLEAEEARIQTGFNINRSVLLATVSLFVLLAAVVFLVPPLAPEQSSKVLAVATLIIFISGPLGEIVMAYPTMNQALESIKEIERIERRLDEPDQSESVESVTEGGASLRFIEIDCRRIAFSYRDEHGQSAFSLDPFDFTLSPGELVFITGGNGSGKSTFLKVLAGLYAPASGEIFINGVAVRPRNRQSYRDLFSPVFSDFHLFDRVYGIKDFDRGRLDQLLDMTELSQKTSVDDHRITNIDLSSGQRKRLALVLALLENRSVFLLDEWAAEQDPPFRRKFYREILPELKRQGKTVVAVTHDDDHYEVADRVLKMQFGNFVSS